jgi:hypothetical protein
MSVKSHKWRQYKVVDMPTPETRCALMYCTECHMIFGHFYRIFDNMAHALEIERVPPDCVRSRPPNEPTCRQLEVYGRFTAAMQRNGPVHSSAYEFFKAD